METIHDFSFVQSYELHFRYDKLVTVDPDGTSGGLTLYYNNDYKIILYTSNRMNDVDANILGRQVFLTFVYGDPVPKFWENFWKD